MGKTQPDERLVYLALKTTFRGPDMQLRKPKKIRDLIQKQQNNISVRELIQAHGLDDVCNVTRILLEQQIFESTLKAKIRFPEAFKVSPAQSSERSASEKEAAQTEANAITAVAAGTPCAAQTSDADKLARKSIAELFQPSTPVRKRSQTYTSVNVSSLYPVYLPYRTQHRLLVAVQHVLEKACYGFAVQSLAELMVSNEWECPESVELNVWAKTFRTNEDKFSSEDVARLGKPLPELLDSIAQIRHTAVHRLRVSASRLDQFLGDAESLSRLLHDDDCSHEVLCFRRKTQTTIDDVKRNKDLLESQLRSRLKQIAAQRVELDRLERVAVDDMFAEDKEYLVYTGKNLDESLERPSNVLSSVVPTEREVESDENDSVHACDDVDSDIGRDERGEGMFVVDSRNQHSTPSACSII